MSEFLKELEEDIKEEQFVNLWKKYGVYVIAIGIGVVVLAGAVPAYKSYQASQDLKASELYAQALRYVEKGRDDKAVVAFDSLISSHKGYGVLAKLQKAALLTDVAMKQGKITLMDEAQAIYQDLSAHNAKDPSLRGLALILEAYRAVSMGEEGAWKEQLEPLTAPGQPWRPLALEVLALSDLKSGRETEASKRLVEILSDKTATPTAQRRAMLVLSSLQVPVIPSIPSTPTN